MYHTPAFDFPRILYRMCCVKSPHLRMCRGYRLLSGDVRSVRPSLSPQLWIQFSIRRTSVGTGVKREREPCIVYTQLYKYFTGDGVCTHFFVLYSIACFLSALNSNFCRPNQRTNKEPSVCVLLQLDDTFSPFQKKRLKDEAQKELQGDIKMQEGDLIARVSEPFKCVVHVLSTPFLPSLRSLCSLPVELASCRLGSFVASSVI